MIRTVHDVSTLRLDRPATEGTEAWCLIRVTPASHSGVGIITDYADPQGNWRKEWVAVIEGDWRMLAGLTDSAKAKGGHYRWLRPVGEVRGQGLEALFCPFERGGTAVCRYSPDAEGRAQLQPTFLVPRAWEAAVLAAYEFSRKAPGVLGPQAPVKRGSLVALVRGDNPLLSVAAFRRLVESRNAGPDHLVAALAKPDAYRRATVTYMALVFAEGQQRNELLDMLGRAVAECKTADEIRPLAVAAYGALLLHNRTRAIPKASTELLKKVKRHLVNLGENARRDPVLEHIIGSARADRRKGPSARTEPAAGTD
jgi:hypothetical protein